jgi:hypothetical protein
MAQVALAWLRYREVPVISIIGARKLSPLEDNLASLDLKLSAEQVKKLDEASRIELGFPESMCAKELLRGFRYGVCGNRLLGEGGYWTDPGTKAVPGALRERLERRWHGI